MKKHKPHKQKTPNPRVRPAHRDSRAAAWPSPGHAYPDTLESFLGAAARITLESALATVARIAEPYPEEAEAIERVRRSVDQLHGQPDDLQLADVLLAMSILICATDREPTPAERDLFAMLDAVLGVPARSYAVRVPSAAPHHVPIAMASQRRASLASRYASTPSFATPNVRHAA